MSDVKKRAEQYLSINYPYGGDIIRDLLAECERLETEYTTANGRCFECELDYKDLITALESERDQTRRLAVKDVCGFIMGGSFLHDNAPDYKFAKAVTRAIVQHFGITEGES